jgi:serine/threonine protein kinase
MSVREHDALIGTRGALNALDAPAGEAPERRDFTEDLAEEATSELGPSPRAGASAAQVSHGEAVANGEAPPHDATGGHGNLLRDRYLLETQIGSGGAATVHRALDLRREADGAAEAGAGRRVAIKLLRPELRGQPHCVARLQREFRQTQAVAHPNVVRFLDLDRDGDAWFIVMELLSGETVGARMRRAAHVGLPVPEALRVALAAGEALMHAHALGVTHGDVKPGNIFLADGGAVRLIDFGVAPDAPAPASVARAGAPVPAAATRAYASPEVLAGESPEPRDDVFSLANVIYEMIAGRHPYGRRGVDRERSAVVVPERIATLGPRAASALAAALSLTRAGRPSMAEFMQALRPAEPADKAAGIPPAAAVPLPLPVEPAPARPDGRSRIRRTLLAVGAVASALAIGILIGRVESPRDPPRVSLPPSPSVAERAPEPAAALASPAATVQPDAAPAANPAPQAGVPGIAPEAPSAPTGLVFFDGARMVVSRHAVVAPIPLRHLNRARRAVDVQWRIIEGSARAGRDFGGPVSGTESFVEGNSFRMLYVPIVPDVPAARDRSFTVELTGVSAGAEVGPTPRVEVTILGGS